MNEPRRAPTRAIGLGVVTALVIGIAAALWSTRPPAPPASPAPETLAPGDDAVSRTLDELPEDSLAIKTRWHDEVVGVEYADLDGRRREAFVRLANSRFCDCGCGYTLAGCKASDMQCDHSGRLLETMLDSLRAGLVPPLETVRRMPGEPSTEHP